MVGPSGAGRWLPECPQQLTLQPNGPRRKMFAGRLNFRAMAQRHPSYGMTIYLFFLRYPLVPAAQGGQAFSGACGIV